MGITYIGNCGYYLQTCKAIRKIKNNFKYDIVLDITPIKAKKNI